MNSQNNPDSNLRFFERVPVAIPVAYKILRDSKNSPMLHAGKIGQTVDISAVGLKIRIKEKLEANALIQIALDFYRSDQPILMNCRVVRCVPAQTTGFFEVGLISEAISTEDRRRMNGYINKLKA